MIGTAGRRPATMIHRLVALAAVALVMVVAACGGDDSEPEVAATTPSSPPVASGELLVALEIGPSAAVDTAIPALVRVTNDTGGAVVIIRPEISPNFVYFEVVDASGATVPFDGPWLSLRPLEADDFVELAQGESVEHRFDLAFWYTLAPGSYTVTAEYLNDLGGGESGIDALIVDGVVSSPADLEVG